MISMLHASKNLWFIISCGPHVLDAYRIPAVILYAEHTNRGLQSVVCAMDTEGIILAICPSRLPLNWRSITS